ncbi:hypothetical protein ACFXTH_026521 [Malus domestica]
MCRILKSFRSPLNEFNLAKISANSFSNRCSWTKPISIWTSTSDADHALLAGHISTTLEDLNRLRELVYYFVPVT